jgi:hypothetical protein
VIEQRGNVVRHALVRERPVDVTRPPVPLHVTRDGPATGGEAGKEWPEARGGHVGAVEQQHGDAHGSRSGPWIS